MPQPYRSTVIAVPELDAEGDAEDELNLLFGDGVLTAGLDGLRQHVVS